ncbi:cell wall hydrolase [Falsochrobactrum shanghaiense]|uniref:Cell wall hydrolase n=1 Tax=Falsochrobactrum shanghaiense TaxID=2201899 RepID=A0A316JC85_9HYPH|nr:cell wall hydrolase [Falsochrobactrum shanghaiense]PWL19472.1 cell wall hydrolase [Falsochrobactrum shanghaiense]
MTRPVKWKLPILAGLLMAAFAVTGCTTTGGKDKTAAASHVKTVQGTKTFAYTARDRECLQRAMFFESNRSSPDGLVAVGTVVMNRLANERYPDTICGVVGQKKQFAPGVLTRKMKPLPDVEAAADAVLKGKRHPKLKNAMFFHTAGLKFPYRNMHYVLVAGGNSFYEKRRRDGSLENPVPQTPYALAYVSPSQAPSAPQPDVQSVLAQASGTPQVEEQGIASGPGAGEERLATLPVKPADKPQLTQMAAYQPVSGLDEGAAQSQTISHRTQLGYGPDNERIDAIGALLLAQERPHTPL